MKGMKRIAAFAIRMLGLGGALHQLFHRRAGRLARARAEHRKGGRVDDQARSMMRSLHGKVLRVEGTPHRVAPVHGIVSVRSSSTWRIRGTNSARIEVPAIKIPSTMI